MDLRAALKKLEPDLQNIALALLLVAVMAAVMSILQQLVGVSRGSVAFLVPVVVAAIRWGAAPAIAAAIVGAFAAIFFFYPPLYEFKIANSRQAVDIALFICVALLVSRLAAQLSAARVRAEGEVLRRALIDSVSHELRTPLSSILGSATVLKSAPTISDDERLTALVRTIREEAERLDRDIQNLLDASRVTGDGLHPQKEPADPADIVNSALARCRSRLQKHGIETDIAADLPFIHVDSALIEQALVQLMDNAAKYSPPTTVIRVAAHNGKTPNAVTISVTDQGRGLSEQEMNTIWHRFFRGDRRDDTAGSGLGLWIAKAFVTANNGRLTASSAGHDLGATFEMTLPVSTADARRSRSSLEKHAE